MPLYTVHLYPRPRVGVHRIRADDPVAAIEAAHQLAVTCTQRLKIMVNEDIEVDFSDAIETGNGSLVDELREDGELVRSRNDTAADPPQPEGEWSR